MILRDRIRTILARGPMDAEAIAGALQLPIATVRPVLHAMRGEGQLERKYSLAPPKPRPAKAPPVVIERHVRGKLTDAQREAIRASGERSGVLARRYGVHRSAIWAVRGRV